jgi:hypothetical protein
MARWRSAESPDSCKLTSAGAQTRQRVFYFMSSLRKKR